MFGGFSRLLLIITLGWLGWLVWRRIKAHLNDSEMLRPPPERHIKMLRCEQCGLHVPAHEVVRSADGHVYCCDEHRRLAAK